MMNNQPLCYFNRREVLHKLMTSGTKSEKSGEKVETRWRQDGEEAETSPEKYE